MSFLTNNKLYTDASLRQYVGISSYIPHHLLYASSIPGKKDINRAELAAIYVGMLLAPVTCLQVFTDSKTALDLVSNKFQRDQYHLLVYAIQNIASVKYNNHVQYNKVKAHSGVFGNEVADYLARKGALIAPDFE